MISSFAEASMIETQVRSTPGEPDAREHFGRKITIRHAAMIALIAIMALAGCLTLERAIYVQRAAGTAIELAGQQQMLSQRIASLTAQFALGNSTVRGDLRSAVDSFENTHWRLVAGDPDAGFRSAIGDAPRNADNFNGPAPLDAAATVYVAQARRILAVSPHDPSLAARATLIFAAAQNPLLDELAATMRIRHERAEAQLTIFRLAALVICLLILTTLLTAALMVFRPLARRIIALTRDVHELNQIATTDPLTGVLNIRSFQARGAVEVQKARRYQRPLSLLMIDADQLPAIEAVYGSDGGETMLKSLTSSFCDGTRISDLIARVDAERFAILLPETTSECAGLLAERLRQRVGEMKVNINEKPIRCTISVGVAAAEKDASFLWSTFKRADEALHEAKMRGRNRVFVAA
jgi:diguanylate cyclase (GGDEF)-like protein